MEEITQDQVIWDLSDLYAEDLVEFHSDLDGITDRCKGFQGRWKGILTTLNSNQWDEMIKEYEDLVDTFTKLGSFVRLSWSVNTTDPEIGRRMQMVQEKSAMASRYVLFFSLEIGGMATKDFEEVQKMDVYKSKAHWFDQIRASYKYSLSEEAEYVLMAKSQPARSAWIRFSDERSSAQMHEYRGESLTTSQLLKKTQDDDREVRREVSELFSSNMASVVKENSYIFNTVLTDHSINDRLRGYPTWVSERNEDNQVSDDAVQILVDSVISRYDLLHRFYRLKRRLLNLSEFHYYDRGAQIPGDKNEFTWAEAREIVCSSYHGFSPVIGKIVDKFFDENWIHAPILPAKNSGAYSASTAASVHPYIFLNFSGTSRDVRTLAHELGHGVHQYLARVQGPFMNSTPLTVAETASVFGEMITFSNVYGQTTDPQSRLAILMQKIDDMLATVYRQVSFNRFEDSIHNHRRTKGELTPEMFNEHWMDTQRKLYGDTVILHDDYKVWWSYISHFIHTPGYVYAYAFGELLVLALYDVFRSDQEKFKGLYIDMLTKGGSEKPEDLLAPFGLNLLDPDFWKGGLAVIERFIGEAEKLADQVSPVKATIS